MIALLLLVAAAHIPILLLPGPDSALVVGSASLYSRRRALFNTLGIVLGSIILVIASLTGLGILITTSPVVFNSLKIIGAAYLVWRGISLIRTRALSKTHKNHLASDGLRATLTGLLTEVSNPKAIIFFIGVFAVIHHYNERFVVVSGVEIIILTAIYYSCLSVIASKIKSTNLKIGYQFTIKCIVAAIFFITAILLVLV
jgi:threonine/homoserine/homoserine lactone efflux protein